MRAAVPSAVPLQAAQIGVDHAAAERVADEIEFAHVEILAHAVGERPQRIDMVAMRIVEVGSGVVLAEVIRSRSPGSPRP